MNAAECRRVYEMASIVECVASDKAGVTLRADATTTHREHPRITTWLDAVWHQKETRASVGLLDLSAGGCFIRSLDPSPPTGEFRRQLSLPDGTSLWVTVGVAYARPSVGTASSLSTSRRRCRPSWPASSTSSPSRRREWPVLEESVDVS